MHISAIVVAAGRGTRIGSPTAKAFLRIGDAPMIVHSLRTLSGVHGVASCVLVVGAEQFERTRDVLAEYGPWPVPVSLAPGGAERQDSVAAGLAALEPRTDMVVVHDAARPFVSRTCVHACIEAAAATGAAIVAIPAHDTVKVVDDHATILRTLERRTIWLAQTPQVFRAALLRQAYERARHDDYVATDDAALVERMGGTVRVVTGAPSNRKITSPDDLRWAEWYWETTRAPGSE